ncbi:hypothetical protein HAX54_003375 [Datura stramonium]|uniref:Uncharacterized protein n=1 Tax=Datura stramonium TaxID=4076 RepID=A0ABS8T6S7_DATST|nr:hypothetical protein [Datura stramonium]
MMRERGKAIKRPNPLAMETDERKGQNFRRKYPEDIKSYLALLQEVEEGNINTKLMPEPFVEHLLANNNNRYMQMTGSLTESEMDARIRTVEIPYTEEEANERGIVIFDMQNFERGREHQELITGGQLAVVDQPSPILVDDQLMEKAIEDSATLWV